MATDRKLNTVNSVSDAAFIYAETTSGETVKISKANLAAVIGGLLGNPLGYVTEVTTDSELNNAVKSGYYSIKATVSTTSGNKIIYGTMIVITTGSYTSQIAFGSEGTMVIRRRDVKTDVWDSWRSIGQ